MTELRGVIPIGDASYIRYEGQRAILERAGIFQ